MGLTTGSRFLFKERDVPSLQLYQVLVISAHIFVQITVVHKLGFILIRPELNHLEKNSPVLAVL